MSMLSMDDDETASGVVAVKDESDDDDVLRFSSVGRDDIVAPVGER